MTRRSLVLAILVILVPALAGLMVVSDATTTRAEAGSIPAAIVNLDTPATTADGTTLPAGRLLLGRLTNPGAAMTAASTTGATTDSLDYSVVSAEAADKGLSDGTYDVVITIPQGFSDSIVKTLAGTPTAANVDVRTNGSAPAQVGAASSEIVSAAADSLGTTVSVAYLNGSLTSLGTMKTKLGEAATGARDLSTGAGSLKTGADDLDTGATQAAQGASSLAEGLRLLTTGTTQLSDGTSSAASGAGELASGAGDLATGASSLASGASTVDSGAGDLATGASSLASGASTVDSGAGELATGASTLATGVSSYVSGVTDARDALTVPQNGAAASLTDGASRLASGVGSYTAGVDALHEKVTAVDPTTGASLATGASSLADGAGNLSEGISSYTGAVDTLADRARQAGAGMETAYRQCVTDHGEQDATCQYLAASTAGMGRSTDAYDPATGANTDGADATMLGILNTLSSTAEGSPRAALTSGASRIAAGATGLASAIGTDPASTDPTTVVGALGALSAQSGALSDAALAVSTGLGSASDVYDPADPSNATLAGVLNTLVNRGGELSTGATNVSSGASTLSGGTSQLSTGAKDLSSGASTLSGGTSQLSTGAKDLSSGASTLSGGTDTLSQGLQRLMTGASEVASGTASASTGADSLSEGLPQLSTGAGQLSDGASQLSTGATTLSDGLTTAKDSVPSYTDQQAADLAGALAQPVGVEAGSASTSRPETSVAPAAIALALWVGALVIVSGLGVMTRRRMEAPMSPVRLAAASLRPALGLAIVQALALVGVVSVSGAQLGSVSRVLLLAVVGAIAMTTLHAALVAAFGPRGGTAVSLLTLVAQAVLVLGRIVPATTGAVRAAPVGSVHAALSNIMLGATGQSTSGAVVGLLVWAAASALVMTLAVRRRRSTSVEALRHELAAV